MHAGDAAHCRTDSHGNRYTHCGRRSGADTADCHADTESRSDRGPDGGPSRHSDRDGHGVANSNRDRDTGAAAPDGNPAGQSDGEPDVDGHADA